MELLVLFVIVTSLLLTVDASTKTVLAGNLIGIYNYILKFVSGLDTIPYTVQRVASLRDILQAGLDLCKFSRETGNPIEFFI